MVSRILKPKQKAKEYAKSKYSKNPCGIKENDFTKVLKSICVKYENEKTKKKDSNIHHVHPTVNIWKESIESIMQRICEK